MIERSLDWIKVSKLKLPLANTKYRTTAYASGVRMHFVCGLVLAFYLNLFSVITRFRQMKRLGKARNEAKLNSLSAIMLYQIGQSHKN